MRRALVAVTLAAGLLLTGCGIPDETDVVPLRRAPTSGVSANDNVAPPRNSRADTTDPAEFAKNYLEAAAGDFANATERAKQFMTEDAKAKYKPVNTEIRVIRLTEEPLVNPGQPVVINAREVGTLGAKGTLTPSADDEAATYSLELTQVEGQQGLFIAKAPNVLLLSDTALNRFYAQRTIYFWNVERSGLVPDVRYMPTSVPPEQQPTEIMNWLTSGPASWLGGVAAPLPEDTKTIGNVPAIADDTLQISLSNEALDQNDVEGSLDRLQKQLRWSLRPYLTATLRLTVENQVERDYVGSDYLSSNAAYRTSDQPERFVVYNSKIARLARSYNSSLPVPIVKPDDNRAVRMAALSVSGGRSYAALVVNESRGRLALKAGAAGTGEQATLRRTPLPLPVGRPVWGRSLLGADNGTVGLIPAGGNLYAFEGDGTGFAEVEWTGRPGAITAVAIAPDARRVALLAGGHLYVAGLNVGDGVQLSEPHPVHTVLSGLTAVDWSSEGYLVVSGVRPDSQRVAIMEVSIDGAAQTYRLQDLGSNPVTYLTAMPANPTRGEETSGAIAYVQGNAAYDEVEPDRITVGDLAERVENPPEGVLPGAPFFVN
jgi:hypothetical protein